MITKSTSNHMTSPHPQRLRAVTIERVGDTFFVKYVLRKKRQRHSAAQFSAKDHTVESVEGWVRDQAHLHLLPS
jgi:hypothetical protein